MLLFNFNIYLTYYVYFLVIYYPLLVLINARGHKFLMNINHNIENKMPYYRNLIFLLTDNLDRCSTKMVNVFFYNFSVTFRAWCSVWTFLLFLNRQFKGKWGVLTAKTNIKERVGGQFVHFKFYNLWLFGMSFKIKTKQQHVLNENEMPIGYWAGYRRHFFWYILIYS